MADATEAFEAVFHCFDRATQPDGGWGREDHSALIRVLVGQQIAQQLDCERCGAAGQRQSTFNQFYAMAQVSVTITITIAITITMTMTMTMTITITITITTITIIAHLFVTAGIRY